MGKPTYEELEAEVERLRAISFGDDKEFTQVVKGKMPELEKFDEWKSVDKITIRPGDMWKVLFGDELTPRTHDLAILGRSLQALGWRRSADRGNVVFKMSVEDYHASTN